MLHAEERAEIFKKYARTTNDTGSPEVQVALLTKQIANLTEHLKVHRKDVHSQLGLKKQVGQRRRLLNYLDKTDHDRYVKLITSLELRR